MSKLKSIIKKHFWWFGSQDSYDTHEKIEKTKRKISTHKAIVEENHQTSVSGERSKEIENLTVRHEKSSRRQLRRRRTSIGILESIIICPLCKSKLTTPKVLSCQHYFCEECLKLMTDKNNQLNGGSLRCPVCKSITRLPKSVDNLPTNTGLVKLLEAINTDFVDEKNFSQRDGSLFVNFKPLATERKISTNSMPCSSAIATITCTDCDVECEGSDYCRHCKKVVCSDCQKLHLQQLNNELNSIKCRLQVTNKNLEEKVVNFQVENQEMSFEIKNQCPS